MALQEFHERAGIDVIAAAGREADDHLERLAVLSCGATDNGRTRAQTSDEDKRPENGPPLAWHVTSRVISSCRHDSGQSAFATAPVCTAQHGTGCRCCRIGRMQMPSGLGCLGEEMRAQDFTPRQPRLEAPGV